MRHAAIDIVWRLAFVGFAIALQVAGVLVLRPAFGARFWAGISGGRIEVHPAGVLILAAFWILGGATIRALFFNRSLVRLLLIRCFALLAGSAAVLMSFQMVMAIAHSGWPLQFSMGIVSLFSLAMYGCWRWISLLLTVVEDTGTWKQGWFNFAHMGVGLAMAAATNSTLKWFFLTITAMPAIWLWQRGFWNVAACCASIPVGTSGYFAARLRESIRELVVMEGALEHGRKSEDEPRNTEEH